MDHSRITPVTTGINQTSVSQASTHSVGSMSHYGMGTGAIALREGDILQGEITDLRNNEITVTLKDNTNVTGYIEDSSKLFIGEISSFRIKELSPRGITLEAIPQKYSASEQLMINKALEESGFPKNDKNIAIVKALMDNNLPINKQSIQHILQQSYLYKDVDISTLVLMNRHHLPITQEMASQFENYRNYEHQLMTQIDSLSEKLPALLEALSENGPEQAVADFGARLLSLLTDTTTLQNGKADLSLSFLSSEDRLALLQELSALSLTEEMKAAITDGSAKITDILNLIKDLNALKQAPATETEAIASSENTNTEIAEADVSAGEEADLTSDIKKNSFLEFGKNFAAAAKETLNGSISMLQNALQQAGGKAGTENPPIIQAVLSRMNQLENDYHFLSGILGDNDRKELAKNLSQFPVSRTLLENITNGTASTREVITVIKNLIPMSDAADIKQFFQNPSFQQLFKADIIASWTLTPKDLADKSKVDSFYPQMEKQLSSLENLINSSLSGDDSTNLSNQAGDMQDNILFMKALNEMFTYMQLPLKLQGQNVHSDLYVYTKKNSLRDHPDKISVLLHLDMEHLGQTDIHIQLDGKHVQTKFYLPEDDSLKLLTANTNLLREALNDKGFTLQTEILPREKQIDIVKDFMEADSKETGLKRYAFDIRA